MSAGMAFLMCEMSTLFVHTTWLMDRLDMCESKAYLINEVLEVTTFFTFRCVYGPCKSCLFGVQCVWIVAAM